MVTLGSLFLLSLVEKLGWLMVIVGSVVGRVWM